LKKIKVAHVLYSVGGVEVYLDLVTKNINSNAIENIIIHSKKNKVKEYLDSSGKAIKQFFIPVQRDISIVNDFKCVYQTVKILKKEKPDLIHAHSAKGGIIARLASLFYPVTVLHTPHAYSYLSTNSKLKKVIFLTIERVFKNFNSVLLATSNSELKRGIEEVGYKPSKALLFNNSILPVSVKDLELQALPKTYICTVGRPSYQKNIELMIEVLKKIKKEIPNIHLVVMGLGVVSPNTESVKGLVSKYNLEDNITLIEWIERDKIFHILKGCRFYLSTSRYEGLPYSVIECLSLKKAIVASNCDGNRDLVINNHNGYLIEDTEVDLFVQKCIELYNNSESRKKFERNSYALFKENFDLSINIKGLEGIYLNNY
jgi:glycosyltransferase involved in cell wall biosynthesis